jgi:hypothetical protein
VFVYKAARGLDALKPRTAAVQQQVASEIAGVAFSCVVLWSWVRVA